MLPTDDLLPGLGAALGGGLLLGIERERRNSVDGRGNSAGVRTFTTSALIGASCMLLGAWTVAAGGLAIASLALSAYHRQVNDRAGLTTPLAMLATFFFGAISLNDPRLGAGLAVALATLLHSEESLHHFARRVLDAREVSDVMLLASSLLIVMPLLPNRPIDPWSAVNPRQVWLIAVLVIAINAAGHVALRAMGARLGLAIVGLLGGFVSSAATVAVMGQRAHKDPQHSQVCIAAALFSCVATVLQLALVIGVVSVDLLQRLALPLIAAACTTAGVAGFHVWRGRQASAEDALPTFASSFALPHALLFAGIVALSLLLSTWLRDWLGDAGVVATATLTGLIDVHAAAIGLAKLASDGSVSPRAAGYALAAAFSANSLMKCVAAATGGKQYALRVASGVVSINAVLVVATWWSV
jgi:uncharacterized membrane protein (DUF4010 family)